MNAHPSLRRRHLHTMASLLLLGGAAPACSSVTAVHPAELPRVLAAREAGAEDVRVQTSSGEHARVDADDFDHVEIVPVGTMVFMTPPDGSGQASAVPRAAVGAHEDAGWVAAPTTIEVPLRAAIVEDALIAAPLDPCVARPRSRACRSHRAESDAPPAPIRYPTSQVRSVRIVEDETGATVGTVVAISVVSAATLVGIGLAAIGSMDMSGMSFSGR